LLRLSSESQLSCIGHQAIADQPVDVLLDLPTNGPSGLVSAISFNADRAKGTNRTAAFDLLLTEPMAEPRMRTFTKRRLPMFPGFPAIHRLALAAAALSAPALSSNCGPSGGTFPSLSSELTQTQETTHFTFHFSSGDSVDAARTEAFYAWAAAQLSADPTAKIQYYKFRDVAQKTALTGNGGNAESYPWQYAVHTIWSWDNHEITHVLSYPFGEPPFLFNEGLAVSMQVDPLDNSYTASWNGQTPHAWAKQYLQQGTLLSVPDVSVTSAFMAADPNTSYPSAGSWVGFLIEEYGLQRLLQFFNGAKWDDSTATTATGFQRVFDRSLSDAEQDWHTFLQQY
jgi:hypothetical protein